MTSNPYQLYRAASVNTASRVELVLMLYQGVSRFAQQGIRAVEQRKLDAAHEAFVRAQDIVLELTGSLDYEAGGELARGLAALYDYAYRRLVEANLQKATAPAIEVLGLFRDLLPVWRSLAEADRALAGEGAELALSGSLAAGRAG